MTDFEAVFSRLREKMGDSDDLAAYAKELMRLAELAKLESVRWFHFLNAQRLTCDPDFSCTAAEFHDWRKYITRQLADRESGPHLTGNLPDSVWLNEYQRNLLNQRSRLLWQRGHHAAALACLEELLLLLENPQTESDLCRFLSLQINRATLLDDSGRKSDASALLSGLIEAHRAANAPAILSWVLSAYSLQISCQTDEVSAMEQIEAALKECAEFTARIGMDCSSHRADFLLQKGVVTRDPQQSLVYYDECAAAFDNQPDLSEFLACALVNQSIRCLDLHDFSRTIQVCDQVLDRFQDARDSAVQQLVQAARENRELALQLLHNPQAPRD